MHFFSQVFIWSENVPELILKTLNVRNPSRNSETSEYDCLIPQQMQVYVWLLI